MDRELLKTRLLFLPANFHFYIVALLYIFLSIAVAAGAAYNYYNLPNEFMGFPVPDEQLVETKAALWKYIGGVPAAVFFAFSTLTVLMTLFPNKYWFAFCTMATGTLVLTFVGYDATILFYFELKYIWPFYFIGDLTAPQPPGMPFTLEEAMVNFVKVGITVLTIAMFAVIVIQAYCLVVLFRVTFLYTPKEQRERAPRSRMSRPRMRAPREERVEEEEEVEVEKEPTGTGTDAEEKE